MTRRRQTNIRLPIELIIATKRYALERDVPYGRVIERALCEHLERERAGERDRKAPAVPA